MLQHNFLFPLIVIITMMKSMPIWLNSVLKLALTIKVRETGDILNRVIVVKSSHNLQLIQPFWPTARHYKKKVKGSEVSTSWKLQNLEDAHFTVRNRLKLNPLFFNCQWITKKKRIVSSDANERKYKAKIYVIVFFYTQLSYLDQYIDYLISQGKSCHYYY